MRITILLAVLPSLAPVSSAGGQAPAAVGKIKVENGAGATLFELKPSANGFQIDDAGGRKLGSVKVEADRVKVANAAGQPAFKVKQKAPGFKLYREPAGPGGADVELARFSPEGDGFRVKDASDRELYRGKKKEAKMKVTGLGGRTYDLKLKADGIEVEDGAGKRLVRIKGLKSPAAAVFCAAPEFNPLQKAAVAAFSARIGP